MASLNKTSTNKTSTNKTSTNKTSLNKNSSVLNIPIKKTSEYSAKQRIAMRLAKTRTFGNKARMMMK